MGEFTIYLDVVFIINFVMDYLILWATAKFTGFTSNMKQLLLASLIGALYSLAIFLPLLHYAFTFLMKLLVSMVMVYVAFYPLRWKKYLQILGYFYLVACTAGGAMLGSIYFINNNKSVITALNGVIIGSINIKYTFLMAAMGATVLVGLFGAKVLRKNFLNSIMQIPIIIRIGAKRFTVKALVDTGNSLKDPISGTPVIVTELNVLGEVFPPDVKQRWEEDTELDINILTEKLADTPLANRIRVIPFSSVGNKKGMLMGIRPDEIILVYHKTPIKISKVIVGVYNNTLSSEGQYKALLHPELLQNALFA